MLTTDKQKKCYSCEELVHPYATSCPYCGAELTADAQQPSASAYSPASAEHTDHDVPAAPYTPSPYTPPGANEPTAEESPFRLVAPAIEEHSEPPAAWRVEEPEPEQAIQDSAAEPDQPTDLADLPDVENTHLAQMRTIMTPMLLLLGGTVFFLFGLALFLYSKDGVFTLHWNGDAWPVYLVASLAMLFFGWKSLHTLEEAEGDFD